MTTPFSVLVASLATFVATLALPSPSLATQPSDLCTGNPCAVTGAIAIDAGSVLDFGAVDLLLKASATLTVGPSPNARQITLRAGRIVLEPGARVLGGAETAEVTLEATTGDVEVQRSGATPAVVDVSANVGGAAFLHAAGKVIVQGTIDVQGDGRDAQGGLIELEAGGDVSVTGILTVAATSSGSAGGEIALHAGGGIQATGSMSSAGGDFGAGDIGLAADGGDVTLGGTIEAGGGAPEGYGGALEVIASAGSVTLGATVNARGGSGAAEACGDGGGLLVDASGSVVFAAPIDLTGGRHCLGGSVLVMAGADLTQLAAGSITSTAPGGFGGGGEIDLLASGSVALRKIDVTSPGGAGFVTVDAASHLSILDRIDASGSGANGYAGAIDLTACEIDVASTGRLSALGFGDAVSGVNTLRAGGAMTIAGTLEAATANQLRHRTVAPTVTGNVTPAATIVLDPTVRGCPVVPVCGNGAIEGDEACDDGNTASCDGCRGDCTRADAVCGDAIGECGEACDDGNDADGDGCETTCELSPLSGIRRPGAPRATAGCLAEWSLGPSAAIEPETGFAAVRQACIDGDPTCDRDGVADGVCTLELRACLRAPDPSLLACTPSSIESVKLRTPRSSSGDAVDAENAGALRAALAALGVTVREGSQIVEPGAPVQTSDACTAPIAFRVPLSNGAPATRKLSIGARDSAGLGMTTNPLRLRCKPRPERCGDGIVQAGEECDAGDANGAEGGRCDAACALAPPALRIPGGSGSRRHDCPLEWAPDLNPSGVRTDRRGVPTYVQSCRDGDPSCDLDPTPGNCRIRLWACVGGADARLGCAASAVQSVSLLGPRPDASHAFETGAHTALVNALGALGLPAGSGETCTRHVEVDVPTGPSRLTLRVATAFGDRNQVDSDALVLRCRR